MKKLNRKEITLSLIWAFALISFFVIVTFAASKKVYKDKLYSRLQHEKRFDFFLQEDGSTEVDSTLPTQENAKEVLVGMYVDHIVDLSTKNTSWTVDFYLWFRWQDSKLHPGNTFQVLNGEILSSELVESTNLDNEKYELYRVVAQITKFFNVTRYPCDNHALTIAIEDKALQWQYLKYIPDKITSDVSSRVKIPGYKVSEAEMVSKPHPYKTTRGDTRFTAGQKIYYNQLIYGLNIYRPDWGLYFKMFQVLFASVAIALLVFLMNPNGESRVGLGIGAFFAAVASSYVTTAELPGVGIVTLSDIVNILGMITIFLSVLCSIMVMKITRNGKNMELAGFLDRVSIVIFIIGYVVSNVIIANTASY